MYDGGRLDPEVRWNRTRDLNRGWSVIDHREELALAQNASLLAEPPTRTYHPVHQEQISPVVRIYRRVLKQFPHDTRDATPKGLGLLAFTVRHKTAAVFFAAARRAIVNWP